MSRERLGRISDVLGQDIDKGLLPGAVTVVARRGRIVHFKALGRPESFDVALRMWRLESAAATERYEELLTQLDTATEKDDIATRSFSVAEGDIRGVGFLDSARGVVVLFTCGQGQCSSTEDAVALAHIIYDRVKILLPMSIGDSK